MNKIFQFLFLIISSSIIISCAKDDDIRTEPLRDYAEQYPKDLDSIDKFLDTHYMEVDTDYNVIFTKIPANGTQQSIRQQTQFPLDFIMAPNTDQDVNYKIYFIKLREGTQRAPSEVDSVHVAYRGTLVNDTQFDLALNPIWFELQAVVPGWAEIIPEFKTGTYDPSEGPNPVIFDNYGAGIMFLPSALGYYGNSSPSGTIPAYSPLIFSFKLMELRYRDHDRDGILSKDERDPNDANKKLIDYDSDGDGFANFFDIDDDGDRVQTKFEIKNPATGLPFSFDAIPDCSGNTTNPARIKKHINPACQ